MNILTSDWNSSKEQLKFVRTQVFIIEQGVDPVDEWDDEDQDAIHFVSFGTTAVPTGSCRLTEKGQIGRLAVLPSYRHQGYGERLLRKAVQVAREMGHRQAFLNAQVDVQSFYEKQGFRSDGKVFLEAGKLHVRMTRDI
ncbi:GNAT family N-acetyltransferase [Marinomonas posidonica]|uniref:GCN5-related N-acetyltransferase n=1 Tax=Marinomonas posidonica (strain CECT 7376 / NCIMB 14433 / IVIA-Po-181) TaxID=491952 RepID=F6CTG4_MARPP|nr:GNAT family N-acetyltransferase [Marinomonas posidonica]AEF54013.1 GCN5-related N-acetyltransferase [Marinomonas posidonica IVIA-Po-181]